MNTQNKRYIGYLLAIIVLGFGVYFINNKDTAPQAVVNDVVATTSPAVSADENKTASSKPKSSASSASQQVAMKDGMYIVSYENTGFKPKLLEIGRGKSVRFVNNSTKALRVGDTTGKPAFETFSQPKTVGKGGTYEYTFNDVGTYEYANQNNTADKGTVVVK